MCCSVRKGDQTVLGVKAFWKASSYILNDNHKPELEVGLTDSI